MGEKAKALSFGRLASNQTVFGPQYHSPYTITSNQRQLVFRLNRIVFYARQSTDGENFDFILIGRSCLENLLAILRAKLRPSASSTVNTNFKLSKIEKNW